MTDGSVTQGPLDGLRRAAEDVSDNLAQVISDQPDGGVLDGVLLDLKGALDRLAGALVDTLPADLGARQMPRWIEDVSHDIAKARAVVPSLDSSIDSDAISSVATQIDERALQRAHQIRGVAREFPDAELASTWLAFADGLDSEIQVARATRGLASISFTASRVQQIAADTQQAAGEVADAELAKAYDEYMQGEAAAANLFRLAAIGSLVIVIAVSAFGVLNQDAVSGTAEALQHVGLAASFLALFGYLARESSHHRSTARWAAVMVVQLKTFKAYAADMSGQQREDLRAFFGRRVFSEVPGDSADGDLTPGSLQAITDLVKALQTKS